MFYLNEKNIYERNVSYWIQIYFDWIKIYFDIMRKKLYDENVSYWIQTYFYWIKIFWYDEKKWCNENIFYWK